MSLQRVFESARKMGVPVIVTDPSGREPMIVLPLDQFEAMGGKGKAMETPKKPARELSSEVRESFGALTMEPPEIPLEERFYLEPTEDGRQG